MLKHNEFGSLEPLIKRAQDDFFKIGYQCDHFISESRNQILSRLVEFQINGDYCDVTLVSSDKATFQVCLLYCCSLSLQTYMIEYIRIRMLITKAHKVILASSSAYFDAMFTSPFCESSQNEVLLPSLDERGLRCLLHFVYSGHVLVT